MGSARGGRRMRIAWVYRVAQVLLAFLLIWSLFFLAGKVLLSLPASFHEGTIWKSNWWEHSDENS